MLIDINTYIGHWPFRKLVNNTLEALDKKARENGITHMVVSNLNSLFYKDTDEGNEELLKAISEYRGKTVFLPLAFVNPTYVEWEKDARRAIDNGFAGFEISPFYHGYAFAPEMLSDEYYPKHRALRVLDLAGELSVPVRICASFENFRGRSFMEVQKNPTAEDLYALLSCNSSADVFVTGFSAAACGEKLAGLLKTRKNTYFDITQTDDFVINSINYAGELVGKGHLCLGTGLPFNYAETNLVKLSLGEDFKFDEGIASDNAKKVFKTLG